MGKKKSKTLGIISLTLGIILFLIIVGFLFYQLINSYYSGMVDIKLEEDQYKNFFISRYGEGISLISKNGKIEERENTYIEGINYAYTIDLNSGNETTLINITTSRRALYGFPNKDPTFKIWVEEVKPLEYYLYKRAVIKQLKFFEENDDMNSEKLLYKNHEYYISLRNNLSLEALKSYNSIGGIYIFLPEKNIVVYIFLFNTKYCCAFYGEESVFDEGEKLITREEMQSIVEQLIDSVT